MFECKQCVYKTPYHSCFKSHLNSKKHTKIIEIYQKDEYGTPQPSLGNFYKCTKCCKPYFSYSGLRGHMKQCEWDYRIPLTPPPSPRSSTLPISHSSTLSPPPHATLPPTPLQLNDIIRGFFNNIDYKRIDTQLMKEKAKEIDNRVKHIHMELQRIFNNTNSPL